MRSRIVNECGRGVRPRRVSVVCALVAALAPLPLAAAQCLEWSTDFVPGHAPTNRVHALLVHDDGSGPALYAGGRFGSVGFFGTSKIARFRNGTWSGLDPMLTPSGGDVSSLAEFNPGSGPKLYIGGWFDDIGNGPTAIGAGGVAQWNGTNWSPLTPPFEFDSLYLDVLTMESFDDGSGPALYFGGQFDNTSASRFLRRWNGSTYPPLAGTVNNLVTALKAWDDGSGPALYVGGGFTMAGGIAANYIARWTGAGWQAVGPGLPTVPNAFAVFDDGSGPALYAALDNPTLAVVRWNGSVWSTVGGGPSGPVFAFAVFDDGSGPALYAAGGFTMAGGNTAGSIARWDGLQWSGLGRGLTSNTGTPDSAYSLAIFDDGGGGAPDLMVGGSFERAGDHPSSYIASWRGCSTEIQSVCAGDGTLRNCPCTNNGAPGFGCAWSGSAQGSWLVPNGTTVPETLVLTAYSMPTTGTSLFLKGDQVATTGIPFGDGIRCIDGTLTRLGTKQNSGGSAQYPDVGDASLSVRGGTPPGSGMIAYYQTYFRNAAAYCTSATFNISNGVRVVW